MNFEVRLKFSKVNFKSESLGSLFNSKFAGVTLGGNHRKIDSKAKIKKYDGVSRIRTDDLFD